MKNSSVALVLIVLNIARVTFAYSVPTHEAITKKAIGISNIRSTISDNLAINLADFDSFYKLQILKGSKFEDGETIFKSDRSLNHFHNPITNRGLTDPIQAGNQSAVTWAISDPENTWSWSEARNYFNEALGSPTAVERRDSYGKMFRALGQVVHLVQDASVPEHVRNDQHLISSVPFLGAFAYEPWLLGHVNPLDYSATAFSFPPNFPIRNF